MWGRNKRPNTIPKPDVQKLRGPSAEASRLRQMWTEAVETYLEGAPPASSLQARWDQVSALCREKAVQICGVLARRTGAPWLAEKEIEVKQMDRWISEAQEADRQIRNNHTQFNPRRMDTTKTAQTPPITSSQTTQNTDTAAMGGKLAHTASSPGGPSVFQT